MNSKQLLFLIKNKFDNKSKIIVDSSDNIHFFIKIISDYFIGKSHLLRQKMIYKIINEYISNGEIHAVSIKTLTKEEFKTKKIHYKTNKSG